MNEFEKIVFRLKAALELRFDKDVATHLGMTKKAFFERKKRDVFPTMNLWALSAMHPEHQNQPRQGFGYDTHFTNSLTPPDCHT